MGCFECLKPPIPQEVLDAIEKICTKGGEIANACLTEKSNIDLKRDTLLREREEKIKNGEKDESLLLEFNKKEVEVEKDYVANEADKMYQLYKLGTELAGPAKDATTKMLDEQLAKANNLVRAGLQSKLNEVKTYTPKQFLNSMYGKPLMEALAKQGLSQEALVKFKCDLINERNKRRQEERTTYNIPKNEFPPDDDLVFEAKDVYEAIIADFRGTNFAEHVRKNVLK
jgi:hypothetical protein